MIPSGISFGYLKIKRPQELACWVTDLMMRGKNIDLNNFKSDALSDIFEES